MLGPGNYPLGKIEIEDRSLPSDFFWCSWKYGIPILKEATVQWGKKTQIKWTNQIITQQLWADIEQEERVILNKQSGE